MWNLWLKLQHSNSPRLCESKLKLEEYKADPDTISFSSTYSGLIKFTIEPFKLFQNRTNPSEPGETSTLEIGSIIKLYIPDEL